MWVKPANNYKYRDPYWFLLNPMKKVEHILDIKSLINYLKINGYHNENTVLTYLYYLKIFFKYNYIKLGVHQRKTGSGNIV